MPLAELSNYTRLNIKHYIDSYWSWFLSRFIQLYDRYISELNWTDNGWQNLGFLYRYINKAYWCKINVFKPIRADNHVTIVF